MSTQAQVIPFGEWLPDIPEHENEGTLLAKNVIPQIKSFGPLNSLQEFSNALTGPCLGLFWAQDGSNNVFNFAGDSTRLFNLLSGVTWDDATGSSGPYSATNWDFTKFGNRVIAVNIADPPQAFDLGVSTDFFDLAGAPPLAAQIATVRDFIVLGDLSVLGPSFLAWSGFNNSEFWDTSGDLATQSDSQQIFGRGGRIQRIVPGEYGVIFQEHSIHRMDYIGPPVVFQIDEVERKRGTPAPNSVIWTGDTIFYYGWDGFYAFDGVKSHPISANRVAKWFLDNAAADALDTMRGAVDRRNRLAIWGFRTSSAGTINNRLVIYNWGADKWAFAEVDTQCLDEFVSPGFSLDALDGPLPLGIDLESIPVDSDQFKGGALNVQAFTANNRAATFDGMPLVSQLTTREISGPDNERLYTNAVRPLVEASGGTTITVEVGTRNRLQDLVSFSTPKSLNALNGEASLRVNSRYQRFRLNISGGFAHANGTRVQSRTMGGRR